MAATSDIEWTQRTWNPVCGCSVISPGCHRCYAMSMARRLKGVALKRRARIRANNPSATPEELAKLEARQIGRLLHYIKVIGDDGRWNGTLLLVPEALRDPSRWKKHLIIFVNSMSDLFHENLSVEDIRRVCEVMRDFPRHTYQVLTKRGGRMRELLTGPLREFAGLPHIWWGVSVENKKHGLPGIGELREVPAAVRFLSVEPLLEDLGELDLSELHWVITGAESGPGARPMGEEWVRRIKNQCQARSVPFFYKQNVVRGKKQSLPVLDGQSWDQMPPLEGRATRSGVSLLELPLIN